MHGAERMNHRRGRDLTEHVCPRRYGKTVWNLGEIDAQTEKFEVLNVHRPMSVNGLLGGPHPSGRRCGMTEGGR
jgi:hypothetical protein